jgi:DNA-directed RNA polymerase III subunit RPC1
VKVRLPTLQVNGLQCLLQGVPTIQRAIINIINKKDKRGVRGEKNDKELLVEGYGLQQVMTTEGRRVRVISAPYLSELLHQESMGSARRPTTSLK